MVKMKIKLKPEPELGDIRIVSKFLWFPKYINREWRWLEKASYKQIYRKVWVALYDATSAFFIEWCDEEWVD